MYLIAKSICKKCSLLDDLVKQLSALRQLKHYEEEIGCVDHILEAYDARVVHQLKDPYLVQHVGGAVAVVEGGDDCALESDLYSNPVQVWHPETQPDIPSGPLPQHLVYRVFSGQLGREAVRSCLYRHEYKHPFT